MDVNADSPWKQAKLFVNNKEIAWGAPIGLLSGEVNEMRVEAPPGIKGALSLGLVNDDNLTVGADPAFNDWVPGSDGKFTWTLTPNAFKSGRVQLVVLSREVHEHWGIECRVLSPYLGNEVTMLMDGARIPWGAELAGGRTVALTLDYKTNALIGFPLTFDWVPHTGLVTEDMSSRPPFGVPSTNHEWRFTGTRQQKGTFSLNILSDVGARALSTTLISLRNELSFRFYYGSTGGDAPLPPTVVDVRVDAWVGISMRLLYSDGSPVTNVPVTLHIPEQIPQNGTTGRDGTLRGGAFKYSTPGRRTLRAVATPPGWGEVSVTLLINVQE
ncbi:hypothetical protein V0M98_16645 [Pseudomonas silesiensis]|jgi:hypothetical protein|uniref:hypothetical protein n=1 Tax=Pseudomonas silesiensis TaxID=1853130 RepID=UPI0030D18CA3